jgi:hypothetical protein
VSTKERIPLLDPRLELTRDLAADERAELGNVSLPVAALNPGRLELTAFLARHNAFGAAVIDGIVMQGLEVGEHTGIQLLGPGDVLLKPTELWPAWLIGSEVRTSVPVRLALFGNDLLAAVYRWPRVIESLYGCVGEQLQRLTAQLVICQLPRVDERVLAMLWLLAESWGHVTTAGIRLPLTLTHETIGALVGARRPTITLALRKLTEDGSIVQQDGAWLLLHGPPQPSENGARILPPAAVDVAASRWVPVPTAPTDPGAVHAELRETVRRLRERHNDDKEQTLARLNRLRTARLRMAATRERIARDAVSRQRPPSS